MNTNFPSPLQAYIVAEAYGRRSEWPSALCQRVVVNGDWKYLNEFTVMIPLSEALFEEIVGR